MNLRRLAGRFQLLLAALLMLAVWVLIVFVASRPALKGLIDLTPQSVNSVDPATEDLLHELREKRVQVEFHLFFPRTAGTPQDQSVLQEIAIRDRLRDLTRLLLVRYRYLGGEFVKVVEHDLTTDLAETRKAAQEFGYTEGVDAVVVKVVQPGREARFRKLVVSVDLADIQWPEMRQQNAPMAKNPVPVLKRFLGELGLSSTLKGLLVQGTPVAYVIRGNSPLVDFDSPTIGRAYGRLFQNLEHLGFEIRLLDLNRTHAVPRDAALVMVLEPTSEFPDSDAQALFEYLRRGGRLFLDYAYSREPDRNIDGGKLGELLGYEVGRQQVFHMVEDNGRAGGRGLDGNDAVGRLRLQMLPHPVTMRLSLGVPLEVAAAREVRPRGRSPQGIEAHELLATGPAGWLARTDRDGQPDFKAPPMGLRQYVVGMSFSVEPEGADKPAPGSAPPQKGEAIVIGGVFCNNVGLPMFGDLAYNICNWMAERKVLMNIQSSKHNAQQMVLQPQQVERVRWLLVYGVPLAFLGLGLVVLYLRRRA